MKVSVVFLMALLVGCQAFATIDEMDWLEGHWMGCEGNLLHDKVISSSLGGIVTGANKVLRENKLIDRDYWDFVQEGSDPQRAKITFYTGVGRKIDAPCEMAKTGFSCQSTDGRFAVTVEYVKAGARPNDVLRLTKRWLGNRATFDLVRAEKFSATCN